MKQPKSIKAWAVVNFKGEVIPYLCDQKKEVLTKWAQENLINYKIIRVEIRPVKK